MSENSTAMLYGNYTTTESSIYETPSVTMLDNYTAIDYNNDTTTESSNSTDEEDACVTSDDFLDSMFVFFYFPMSFVVTFALSFIIQRKRLCRGCCWGRPGILQPMNFIDDAGRRWAYAACFLVLTYDILDLIFGQSYWNLMPTNDKEWMKKFKWVSVLNKLWEVFTVCMVYSPLLVCVDHRHHIPANVVGAAYVIPWIVVYSMIFHYCPVLPGSGFDGAILPLFRIPVYIAFYVVGFSYILDLIRNILRQRSRRIHETDKQRELRLQREQLDYKTTHHFDYVTNLMRRRKSNDNSANPPTGLKAKLMRFLQGGKYEKILGFRYSVRLVCALTVAITLTLWIMILAAYVIEAYFSLGIELLCILSSALPDVDFLQTLCDYTIVTRVIVHTSTALSGLVIIILLINTLISYKRRWHQLLRGDNSWHMYGTTITSPSSVVLSGLKFAGFQVAFILWGWAVLAVVLFLVLMFIAFAFIIPLTQHKINWFVQLLIDIWPSVLLGVIIIPIIQKLICQFVFLQGKGSGLALDNRRIYNAATYYFMILNVLAGVFSCLKRILIPLVLGILFLSRLDQPLIMKGFESKDPGFSAFVSMLLVDLYHNHPVVKTFVELLKQVKDQQTSTSGRFHETIQSTIEQHLNCRKHCSFSN